MVNNGLVILNIKNNCFQLKCSKRDPFSKTTTGISSRFVKNRKLRSELRTLLSNMKCVLKDCIVNEIRASELWHVIIFCNVSIQHK